MQFPERFLLRALPPEPAGTIARQFQVYVWEVTASTYPTFLPGDSFYRLPYLEPVLAPPTAPKRERTTSTKGQHVEDND